MEKKKKLIFICIIIGIVGRLIPHPANFSPLTNICLFAGSKLKRSLALISMFFCIILSDLIINYLQGYPSFGIWSLFTYSGFLIIILAGSKIKKHASIKTIFVYVISSSFGFWLWTNFGCWLFGLSSTHYTKNISGLITCYWFALPYLRNALLGDLCWMLVIFGLFSKAWRYSKKKALNENIISEKSR